MLFSSIDGFVLCFLDWWWGEGDFTVCNTEDLCSPRCLGQGLSTPSLSQRMIYNGVVVLMILGVIGVWSWKLSC